MKKIVRLLCALLVTMMLFSLVACKDEPVDNGPSWQPSVEGEGGTFVPTVGMFVYYIFDCSYSFTEKEYEEHGFDANAGSLKNIMYDEENTWYDELLNRAKETTETLITVCNAAVADGFEITAEDKQAVEDSLVQSRITAAIEGYELNDYLKLYYGCDYITEDVLREVNEMETLWVKYYSHLEEKFRAEVTDQQIADRIKADGLTDTSVTKNIALLLFPYDIFGEESEATAKASLEKYEGKAPSKDEFLSLDGIEGATASYYDAVYSGDIIAPINDWLFSAENPIKIGDMAFIETDYGFCVVYYESDGIKVNESQAKNYIVIDMYDAWLEAAKAKFNSPVSRELMDSVDLDI